MVSEMGNDNSVAVLEGDPSKVVVLGKLALVRKVINNVMDSDGSVDIVRVFDILRDEMDNYPDDSRHSYTKEYISMECHKQRKKRGLKAKMGRPVVNMCKPRKTRLPASSDVSFSLDQLLEAKNLLISCGSFKAARDVLEAANKLRGS